MPDSIAELEQFFFCFHLEAKNFLAEIGQEAGPFKISARRQAVTAKRIVRRVSSIFRISPRRVRANAKGDALRLAKIAKESLAQFRRNVVTRLEYAAEVSELEAKAVFREINSTLESTSFSLDLAHLLTKKAKRMG